MEIEEMRRIQRRQKSHVVTIPPVILRELGIKEGHYARFAVSKGVIIIKVSEIKFTKKDMADIEKIPDDPDDEMPSHMIQVGEALGGDRKPIGTARKSKVTFANRERLEKLRMR